MQIYAEAKNNDTWAKMSVYMGTQFKNTAYENVSCLKGSHVYFRKIDQNSIHNLLNSKQTLNWLFNSVL